MRHPPGPAFLGEDGCVEGRAAGYGGWFAPPVPGSHRKLFSTPNFYFQDILYEKEKHYATVIPAVPGASALIWADFVGDDKYLEGTSRQADHRVGRPWARLLQQALLLFLFLMKSQVKKERRWAS